MSAKHASDPVHPLAQRPLVLTRVFDAPRALVFEAWTKPEYLARWWGPHHFTNPVCEVDLRPGGALLIHMRGPDGIVYPMTGVFQEIVPLERLVFTSTPQVGVLKVLTTVTFEERGGKTTVTVEAKVLEATAAASRMLDGMEAGWSQSLERLGDLVQGSLKERAP